MQNKAAKDKRQRSRTNPKKNKSIGAQRAVRTISDSDKCALRYATALINPFDSEPECLPWTPSIKSRKIKIFARGTCSTGTNGFGYIVTRAAMGNDSGNNIMSTDAAFTGTAIDITGPNTGGKVGSDYNSPYGNADFGTTHDKVQGRITAVGLRVRYIGTELNRNGRVVALEHPQHRTLDTMTMGQLLSFEKAKPVPVSRSWVAVTYQPVFPEEFEFISGSYFSDHYLGIGLSADASNPALFEWEAYCHFEAIGAPVTGKTRSHSSVDLTGKAISEIGQAPTTLIDRAANSLDSAQQVVGKLLNLGGKASELFSTVAPLASLLI